MRMAVLNLRLRAVVPACHADRDAEVCQGQQASVAALDGSLGPDDLTITALAKRITAGGITEVIVATNPSLEGEATALYLTRLLKPLGVKVSRIAQGVPTGSNLEYADQITLARALSGRRKL